MSKPPQNTVYIGVFYTILHVNMILNLRTLRSVVFWFKMIRKKSDRLITLNFCQKKFLEFYYKF